MNKLITTNEGGFPLKMDDFKWMQDGSIEVMKSLISPYLDDGEETMILSGFKSIDFNFNFNIMTITGGYVYHKGEIYPFAGSSYHTLFIGPQPANYLNFSHDFDNQGLKTFKNGDQHEAYQLGICSFSRTANPSPGAINLDNIRRIEDVIKEWSASKFIPEEVVNTGSNYDVYCMRDSSGIMHLNGTIEKSSTSEIQLLLELPTKFKPTRICSFVVDSGNNNPLAKVRLLPNGKLMFLAFIESPSDPELFLNLNLSFY